MAEPQLIYRDAPAVTDTPVALAEFTQGSNAAAVRLEPADDARALLPFLEQLKLVEVAFPAFTDGRGLSSGRALREAGYTGELRAVGEVLVDQMVNYRRCGFDSFAPDRPLNLADVEAALARWPGAYQASVAGPAPIWALRHGLTHG